MIKNRQSESGNQVHKLTIRPPDDFHVHLREGADLSYLVPWTAQCFARAVAMPNLRDPVTTCQKAEAYRRDIRAATPKGQLFDPLMSLFLTDATDAEDLAAGLGSGLLCGAKYYPAKATTQSDRGITDWRRLEKVFETLARFGRPLQIHGEVTDVSVDVFDREAEFIERILRPLRTKHPNLKIVLEHITTREAVEFVRENRSKVAATITAHHLHLNRNSMFDGGFRPHAYCLPVVKREEHRLALVKAATSGEECFFLGSDSAPHGRKKKESSCGCAGIFSAPDLLDHYLQIFESQNALDKFNAFASEHGARFYGLKINEGEMILQRGDGRGQAQGQGHHLIPSAVDIEGDQIQPFRAGEPATWTLETRIK